MKKRLIAAALLLLVVFTIFTACAKKGSEIPEEVLDFYTMVLDKGKLGSEEVIPYFHYEYPEEVELALSSGVLIEKYEIVSVSQVNSELYAFETRIWESRPAETMVTAHHFVGKIDGEYRLMVAYWHVPDELSENLDPKNYPQSPDAMIPDYVE